MTNPDNPPLFDPLWVGGHPATKTVVTPRDLFAKDAPPIPKDRLDRAISCEESILDAIAEWNYQYADAMLAARERSNDAE